MRLIDADELIVLEYGGIKFVPVEFINDAQTIEERKTGKWIDDNCSVCGQYVHHGDARNYCPNCGARMEDDNET